MANEIAAQQNIQQGEIILYQPDETVRLEVRLEDDTVWLTTSQMAALFDREESNIRRHVINVFKEGELERGNNVQILHVNGVDGNQRFDNVVCAKFAQTNCGSRGNKFHFGTNSKVGRRNLPIVAKFAIVQKEGGIFICGEHIYAKESFWNE